MPALSSKIKKSQSPATFPLHLPVFYSEVCMRLPFLVHSCPTQIQRLFSRKSPLCPVINQYLHFPEAPFHKWQESTVSRMPGGTYINSNGSCRLLLPISTVNMYQSFHCSSTFSLHCIESIILSFFYNTTFLLRIPKTAAMPYAFPPFSLFSFFTFRRHAYYSVLQ